LPARVVHVSPEKTGRSRSVGVRVQRNLRVGVHALNCGACDAIRSCQLRAFIRPSYLSHAGRCREVAFSAWASDYAAGIGHGSVLHPMRVSLHAISRSRNHDLPRTEAGRAATSAARRSGNCLLRAEPRSERRAQQRHNRNPCFHGFVLFRNQPRSLTVAFTPGGVTSFTRTNLNFRPPDIVLISTRSPFTFVVLPTLM